MTGGGVVAALLATLLSRAAAADGACNATIRQGWSVGESIIKTIDADQGECCAACTADARCAAFVLHGSKCYLKSDLAAPHTKAGNTCGVVRGSLPPAPPGPPPPPPAPPPPPIPTPPPAPPGSPQWETVEATATPVIGQAQAAPHSILAGFETGQYQRIGDTFYYTANELGLCAHAVWDKVTRAALWSAPNSTGPWTRVTTLRNGSHMYSLCKDTATPYPWSEGDFNYVTWAPTLVHAPSSVNKSAGNVWNLFYSSMQTRSGDKLKPGCITFNGISWAVSTTDSIEGPYVDVTSAGIQGVVVNGSHSFSAWQLRNGSYVGFRNGVKGTKAQSGFSVGLIAAVDDGGRTPGGQWRNAGPDIAWQGGTGDGLEWAPENPVATPSSDGKWYYSVYDALEQPPMGASNVTEQAGDIHLPTPHPICRSKDTCDRIGVAWSADGVAWEYSALLAVQTGGNHPCGQIRTPLGLAPEPERCRGCYSVLWTGITASGFRPVCHAIIRNVNE